MHQKVEIIGYLGGDPQMRYTPDGTPVTNFSVATSEKWKGSDGEKHEKTTWWRVTTWRGRAEVCNQYLRKGGCVYVSGKMNTDPETGGPQVYTRTDGTAGANYEITADQVTFLPSSRDGEGRQGGGEEWEDPAPASGEAIPF